MALPIAPALPAIPSRSAPEADFDTKMFALFKWATEDFIGFMEAWRSYLQTSSTIVGGALNGTTIGQTVPAAGGFTSLTASGDASFDGETFFVDASTNRVGVGITTPDQLVHIAATGIPAIKLEDLDSSSGYVEWSMHGTTTIITPNGDGNGYAQMFLQLSDGTTGVAAQRWLADGTIQFFNLGSEAMRIEAGGDVATGSDNTQTMGTASRRWSAVFAGSGAISTSDARSKDRVTDLDAAEKRVALVAKGLLKKFKFRDAVAAKGGAARWHFGVIAQELVAAFEAEGLDAFDYGLLCWDEWWEADVEVEPGRVVRQSFETEVAAPDHAERFDRYGVRYDELFAFILAAL